jgi:glycine/D-amino acid oxidase-like deaminating enzyme
MRAQVVVIGGGAFGASCFYHLTGRGVRDVVLLEQATLGSGSTGRSAAVVETQYLAPDQVALCAWSIRLFRRLEQEHALPFVHHGYLRLGHSAEDVAGFHESVALQRAHGLHDPRVIGPDEIARIVPALRVDDLAGALWGPSDGYVDAVRYCELLVRLGGAAGGRVLQGRRATGLRLRGGRVTGVECDGEAIECETVVNASGAWARRLGGALGLTLPVDGYRRQLVQFEPPGPLRTPVPMVIDYVPGVEREGLYFRDDTPARIVAGLHWEVHGEAERPQDPDAFRQSVDWDYAERVAEALAARYRGAADFRVTGGWAGLYPLTPDTRPIVGPTPGVDGLYQALGGGGVGVQISPAVGAMVAELITTGETRVMPDWARYRLDRFPPGAAPAASSPSSPS